METVAKGLRNGRREIAPPRAWQRMLSGRRLDLLDPSPLDIEIEDIAQGLARVARWNGQTTGEHAFSVAQHSLVVEDIAAHLSPGLDARWRLVALLHDAPEYVIGDMISPFKAALGLDYRTFEDRLERAIHIRFGLPPKPPAAVKALIKRADRACAYMEAVQLAGFSEKESIELFGRPPEGYPLTIEPQSIAQAQARYLQRYRTLAEASGTLPAATHDAAFDSE
jgi:5'-deoxynucleotidase YfbR-like HD superfamily hydrolase